MSKYDSFWQTHLGTITKLFKEAHDNGKSSEIDVASIKQMGKRVSFGGLRRPDQAR
jgi:hypothetical protein